MSKPTLRKSGKYMVTICVKHHLDLHDIIRAMVRDCAWFGNPVPTSRKAAFELARKFMEEYGDSNWDRVDSELLDQYGTLCAIKAQELFPDMARGLDLSGYNVTRVTPLEETL